MRLLLIACCLTAISEAQTILTYPSTTTGSIKAGGVARYLLPGTPDDVITVVQSERPPLTSASSCIRVIDTTGNTVLSKQCATSSSTERFRIFRSQMHTLEVSENGDNQDLNFQLVISCAGKCTPQPSPSPYPANHGGSITFGQLVPGLLLEGQTHTYIAGASADDVLTVMLEERSPTTSATPCFRVSQAQGGASLLQRCITTSGQAQVRVTQGGNFNIDVYERDNNNAVAYQLRASCAGTCKAPGTGGSTTPPPPVSGTVRFGETVNGLIPPNRPPDRHTFYGLANDVVTFTISERSPTTSATPCIRVLNETSPLTTRCATTSAAVSLRMTTTGVYTIEVYESGNDDPVAYSLTLACSGVCPAAPVSAGAPAPPPQIRLTAAPASLAFTGVAGQTAADGAPLRLVPEGFTGRYETRASETWLTVTPPRGTVPAEPRVEVNMASLKAGEFTATIEVTSPDQPSLRLSIPVDVQIVEGQPSLSPERVTLRPDKDGGSSQYLLLKNPSSKPASFEVSYSSLDTPAAVRVSPASGSIDPGGEQLVEVGAASGPVLSTGKLKATLNGVAQHSVVTLMPRNSAKAGIDAALQSFSFDGPPITQLDPRSLFLLNNGEEAMDVRLEYNRQWLFVSPQTMTIRPGEWGEVTVSANTSGIPSGHDEGLVSIRGSGRAADDVEARQVVAKLDVAEEYAQSSIRPSGVLLYGNAGSRLVCRPLGTTAGSNGGCRIEIRNLASQAVSSNVRVDSSPFFTVSDTGAKDIAAATRSGPGLRMITITANDLPASAKAGVQKTFLTITVGNRTSVIDVHTLVLGSGAERSARSGAASCQPQSLIMLPIGANPELIVAPGATASLDFDIVDNCGEPLRDGTVLADFSLGERGIALRSVSNGRWQAAWQPAAPDGSRISIRARAWSPGAVLTGEARLTAVVLSDASSPVLNGEGIRNYADGSALEAISPGGVVSLKGLNFSERTVNAPTQSWPPVLDDIAVLIGNRRAAIESVSPTQISVQVPFDVIPGTVTDIVVQRGGRNSAPVPIAVVDAMPQIGSLANQPGEDKPAIRRGQQFAFTAFGLGAVEPSLPTGTPASNEVARGATCGVTVSIGGVELTPFLAILEPSKIGRYRIELDVPDSLTAADDTPLAIRCGRFTSTGVSVRVQ